MSFRNRVIILSSLLGVLVILYVVGLSQISGRGVEGEPLVAEGALDDIGTIQVEKSDGAAIYLEGAETNWQVLLGESLYPARPERVDSFLNALDGLRRKRTVTDSAERHEQLGLTEDTATRLVLSRSAGADLAILFGDLAPQGGETFVRFDGDDTVYAVDNALSFYFDQATTYWAELRLVRNLAPEEIVEISVDAEITLLEPESPVDAEYTLTRGTTGQWNLAGDQEVELASAEVGRVASALADFQASDYLVDPSPGLFENPRATISFATEDGQRYRFIVGSELPEDQFALRGEGPGIPRSDAGEPLVFEIGAWSLERVLKNIEELEPGAEET